MAKKWFLALGLAVFAASGMFAVDFKKYPDALKKGNLMISAGIGYGTPLGGTKMAIPPIQAAVDYALPLGGLPFTLGGFFGYTTSTLDVWLETYKYTGMAFGGQLGYHPNLGVKNLDTYLNFALGYYIFKAGDYADLSTFYYGFNLGARYFFTSKIGAFLTLGYSAMSYATVGLTVKF